LLGASITSGLTVGPANRLGPADAFLVKKLPGAALDALATEAVHVFLMSRERRRARLIAARSPLCKLRAELRDLASFFYLFFAENLANGCGALF
jgi:hypothetical protein